MGGQPATILQGQNPAQVNDLKHLTQLKHQV